MIDTIKASRGRESAAPRRRLLRAMLLALLPMSGAAEASAAACPNWAHWEAFQKNFINDSGRVTDPGDGQTTSEGQSYALFFALVANDRKAFANMLDWTENNLAAGDLSARLPAWQWGKKADGTWGVIDDNSASDSDLWIAYSLAEAARLWKIPKYAALGQLLAERILREETLPLKGLGRSLLPGPRGFVPQSGVARLNPSYVPIQLMRRMAALYPDSQWKGMASAAIELLTRSAPKGFAPDWILFKEDGGFQVDADSKGVGAYNAIRVYLWAGMLAADDPVRPVLLKTFAPMARHLEQHGTPPRDIDTRQGVASGAASAGFSAALLPFLAAGKNHAALRLQRLRVEAKPVSERSDNYYDQVLTLFGMGHVEGRFHFGRDGSLFPRWTCASN